MRPEKRILDLIAALAGLIILAPLLVWIALLIKIGDGGPVLFRQLRIGRGGKSFIILKFRTMRPAAEREGGPLTVGVDRRITTVGRLLRRWKLDELPQLWNVIRGEMSLVGPRPEVPAFVALYTDEQRRVLEFVPGMTDPASIRFKHENELLGTAPNPERAYVDQIMPEKIRLNLEYATRSTIQSDLGQILKTILLIFGDVRLPTTRTSDRRTVVRRSDRAQR